MTILSSLLHGCADDSMDLPESNRSEIRFEVTASGVSSWHSRANTTREDALTTGSPLVLKNNNGNKLYLHQSVVTTGSLPTSRGTVTDGLNIEDIGVFAAYNTSSQTVSQLKPDYMYNIEV